MRIYFIIISYCYICHRCIVYIHYTYRLYMYFRSVRRDSCNILQNKPNKKNLIFVGTNITSIHTYLYLYLSIYTKYLFQLVISFDNSIKVGLFLKEGYGNSHKYYSTIKEEKVKLHC